MKGLINLKNKDHKCFMWCHVWLINPQNKNTERINKEDKKIAANLNFSDIVFPLDINDYEKIQDRFQIQVIFFSYENKVYPLYISKNYSTKRLICDCNWTRTQNHFVLKRKLKLLQARSSLTFRQL